MYRDGDLSQPLLVYLDQGGQAPGQQFTLSVPGLGDIAPATPFPIPANQYSVAVTLTAVDDNVSELTQDVTVSVLDPGDSSYTVGSPDATVLHILDNDPAPQLAISQVYASGGEDGATFTHDYVEVFNRGSASVSLAGRSVQYADTESGDWSVIPLTGVLDPGQYYLISGASGGSAGDSLPTADATSSVALAVIGGKAALVDGTAKQYRIPPRVATDVWIKLTGALGDKVLWLAANGNWMPNGEVQMPKAPGTAGTEWKKDEWLELTGDSFNNGIAHVMVRGWTDANRVWQTEPGHAGNLYLNVYRGATENEFSDLIAESKGFSVAAIPIKVNADAGEEIKGTVVIDAINETTTFEWGWRYRITFVSDSEKIEDLDQVLASEMIDPRESPAPTGYFKSARLRVGTWGLATSDWFDDNAIGPTYERVVPRDEWITKGPESLEILVKAIANLKGGSVTNDQCAYFYDLRTGDKTQGQLAGKKPPSDGYKIAASGYTLTMSLNESAKPQTATEERTPAAVLGVAPGGYSGTHPHVIKID